MRGLEQKWSFTSWVKVHFFVTVAMVVKGIITFLTLIEPNRA
jgi:hypothetical protein